MTKKHLVIAVVLAVLAGIVFLRGGNEPPERQETRPPTGIVQQGAREPQSWQPSTAPSEGTWPRRPAPAPREGYPRPRYPGYAESFPPASPIERGAEESFRFRPLSERDRDRIDRQAQGSYGPYGPTPEQWQPRQPRTTPPDPAYGGYPAGREPLGPAWDYPGWGTEGYSLRQVEPSRGTRDRWQGPYTSPARPGEAYRPEPSPFQVPPQWGVVPPERVPPSYRMYPSMDLTRERKLTAR